MSKFFKALEKVEQEREAAAPAAERAATGVTEAETAPTTVMAAPEAVETAPAVAVVTAPPVAVVTPPPAPPAPAERAPIYGAPVARRSAGRAKFAWQMGDDGLPGEPGELDDHLVSVLEPTSFAAEQYRGIRFAIETFRHERGTRAVAISSPGRGDGKTITAINVAGALAQASDARVILVDVDLRHPGVARYLGVPARRGLSTYLTTSDMTADAIIERPTGVGFAVVPAGTPSAMPYELLKSPRLGALLADLREQYDYVVVDAPPVLPFPDVGLLRDVVDGFVVIVRANRTPRELVRDGMNIIGRERVLGVVFNDDERNPVAMFEEETTPVGWRRYVPGPLGGARVA